MKKMAQLVIPSKSFLLTNFFLWCCLKRTFVPSKEPTSGQNEPWPGQNEPLSGKRTFIWYKGHWSGQKEPLSDQNDHDLVKKSLHLFRMNPDMVENNRDLVSRTLIWSKTTLIR